MNKKVILSINLLLGLALIFFSSFDNIEKDVPISISGLRNTKGRVIVQVFRNEKDYEDQKPFKKLTFDKTGIDNGLITVKLKLEPDAYGFTMVDDENANGTIDKNFIGIPKEGFGFSNFLMEKMSKPKFGQFVVDLKILQPVVIKVKYM